MFVILVRFIIPVSVILVVHCTLVKFPLDKKVSMEMADALLIGFFTPLTEASRTKNN